MVIHIGAPKTGSTYLQKRLRSDPKALREAGIFVPVLPLVERMAGNAKLLATAFLGKPTISFARAFPKINVARLSPADILDELIEDWRASEESIILSAENFRPSHARRLRDILPGEVAPVVVLFVRRQDAWIESYFNQLTKTRDIAGDLDSFIKRVCSGDDERFCNPDWFFHYTAWQDAFGDCRVVFYEEAKPDIFSAFLEAADLPNLAHIADIAPTQVSLNTCQLAYLLGLDGKMPFAQFLRHRNACASATELLGPVEKVSFLSPNSRAELAERYEESNRKLLAAVGRQADDPAFAPDDNAAPYMSLDEFRDMPRYREFKQTCENIMDRAPVKA